MRYATTLLAISTLTLAGCGGSSDGGGDDTSEDSTAGSEDAVPTAENWAGMTHDDKLAWMQQEVLPRTREQFVEYDAERYEDFSCATCHGDGANRGEFSMPSLSLPALPATGTPEQQQMVREYPEGTRFMFSRLLPLVQTLLGAPEFDEDTGEGFSCYSCHPHAGDEGSTMIALSDGDEEGDAEEPSDDDEEGDAGAE